LKWIEPATDAEIRRAGGDHHGLIVAPIAFVSEHSETLVELDMDYRQLAERSGVPRYVRVPTVDDDPAFIGGLADLVRAARSGPTRAIAPAGGQRICPGNFPLCPCGGRGG
jgi:ferrochelatase